MPSASRVPAGLASLLGIQNFGELPRDVAYSIGPVMELTRLYLQGIMEHGFCTFTPVLGIVQPNAGLAGATNPTVPAGELWWFEDVTLRINPQAGIAFRGQILLMERPSQATAKSLPSGVEPANSHSFIRAVEPFWATADTNLAANFDQITGVPGADSALMTFRFARLRA
jgi:hypothetical protein